MYVTQDFNNNIYFLKPSIMTYRQKTIRSMAFYLKHKYDWIKKQDAIKELKKIWTKVQISDMIKAYNQAYN